MVVAGPVFAASAISRTGAVSVESLIGGVYDVDDAQEAFDADPFLIFAWRGRTFRSLSAVATAIAGTRWNGPRFFGLRR